MSSSSSSSSPAFGGGGVDELDEIAAAAAASAAATSSAGGASSSSAASAAVLLHGRGAARRPLAAGPSGAAQGPVDDEACPHCGQLGAVSANVALASSLEGVVADAISAADVVAQGRAGARSRSAALAKSYLPWLGVLLLDEAAADSNNRAISSFNF